MGAFNTVIGTYKTPCCQSEQSGWQSKKATVKMPSGRIYFVDEVMENLYIDDIYEGEMHTTCRICGRSTDYTIKEGKLVTRSSSQEEVA